MQNNHMVFNLASCLVALVCCAPHQVSAAPAELHLKPCRVAHVENEAQCGSLEVFENRETRQGRKIAINVVVLPALAHNSERDPLFVFAGGPGQAASDLARAAQVIFGTLNNKRDIVLVDQRGTGKSNGLNCTLPEETGPELADPTKRDEVNLKAVMACRDELEKKADLTQYTTTIAMADIDEVRDALGYPTINLWGASYGTRAALEYLRRYENRVRSVILDAVASPSIALPETFARDSGQVLEKMFVACNNEKKCAAQYPQLKAMLDELLKAINAAPVKTNVADPITGKKQEVTIDRARLLALLFPALYAPETTAMLPELLEKAKNKDFAPLMALSAEFGDFAAKNLSRGMQLSVICAEDVPRIRVSQLAAQPQPFGQLFIDEFTKACASWPKGTMAKDFTQPVKSSKPVLLLSGGLDPVTPRVYAEEVKKTLSNSLHVFAPNIGHGVSHHGCGPKLIKDFIESASVANLDPACLKRLPRPLFFTPNPLH